MPQYQFDYFGIDPAIPATDTVCGHLDHLERLIETAERTFT
jgi:hypothetical protein